MNLQLVFWINDKLQYQVVMVNYRLKIAYDSHKWMVNAILRICFILIHLPQKV